MRDGKKTRERDAEAGCDVGAAGALRAQADAAGTQAEACICYWGHVVCFGREGVTMRCGEAEGFSGFVRF